MFLKVPIILNPSPSYTFWTINIPSLKLDLDYEIGNMFLKVPIILNPSPSYKFWTIIIPSLKLDILKIDGCVWVCIHSINSMSFIVYHGGKYLVLHLCKIEPGIIFSFLTLCNVHYIFLFDSGAI